MDQKTLLKLSVVISVVLILLLINGPIVSVRTQLVLAQSYNNLPNSNNNNNNNNNNNSVVPIAPPERVNISPSPNSNNNNNSTAMPIAPPERVVFSPSAHLPLLSNDRREALEHSIEEDNLLHSPPVPSSGKPIQGPVPGTQTLANNK
jgi:hypothetical protein